MKEEKRIVIVTEDEEQLIELACIFLRHGKSNLELYSDAAFIRDPQTIDRMVADGQSEAYLPAVSGVTFVLKKENFGESTANVTGRIYMDGNSMAEELYEKMETCVERLQEMEAEPEQKQGIDAEPESKAAEQETAATETRLYLAISPVGGAGKTEGTILLGKLLAQQGKRVFYINMEETQDFGYFLDETDWISDHALARPVEELLQQETGQKEITYLKPIKTEMAEEQMADRMISLIHSIISLKKYDVILADVPCKRNWYTLCLQEQIHKVLVFARQDACSREKIRQLEQERNQELEHLYICGLYDQGRKNHLEDLQVAEYLPYTEDASLEGLQKNGCMKTVAELL